MTSRSRIAMLPVAAIATFALAGCGGDEATLDTFTGTWQAHARTLKVTPTGNGREWISLGLGHLVIDLRFKLSQPKGTPDDATATATVTAVRLGKENIFTAARPCRAWASPAGFVSETASSPGWLETPTAVPGPGTGRPRSG